ncbi:MAG: hypothetical protein Q8S41_11005 [Lutibacter sp.]|nr:hypothetical protein [Lutibacter sp.]
MKNQFTSRIVKLTFAFMFVLIASSCSQDDEAMDAAVLANEINSELSAKGAKVSTAVVAQGSFSYSETEVCLGDDLTVTFDNLYGTGSDCGEVQIQYSLDGVVWLQLDKGTVTDGVFSGTLVAPVSGTYSFRADFAGNAGGCKDGFDNLKFQDNTVLAVVVVAPCVSCDIANFTYETSDNQNIVFTYNHDEEVSNITIEFTFPQVMISELNNDGKYVAADGKLYSVNNPTNQTVFTWTGEVSCKSSEAKTFEFSFAPDCNAGNANDGQANIWTDAKIVAINGVALVDVLLTIEDESEINLKEINNLSNIVYTGCPKKK